MTASPTVHDTGIDLRPDLRRVIARFFVPGREDVGPGVSRAAPVIQRIVALDEDDVVATMADIDARFAGRHRDLTAIFRDHSSRVESRIEGDATLSEARHLLLGASFTHEYATEGAALCNPSAVLAPGPDDPSGDARIVVSVRAIGEGHRSSIGFRTGTVSAAGLVTMDHPGTFLNIGTTSAADHHRAVFQLALESADDDADNACFVLDPLPDRFDSVALEARIAELRGDDATRRNTAATIEHLRLLAASTYAVAFDPGAPLSERLLWPHAPAEAHGMEDARFVRFVGPSGAVTYYATYTAFDGTHIAQHLLETSDFVTFTASPVAGAAAVGKGLALFPRQVGGRYVALSRSDRESNAIAFSDDVRCWPSSEVIQVPERSWEVLQLGNCGSPIETERGWLVLTHGVGPMRTYSLGAILLDLDEPQHVIGRSPFPIIVPTAGHRDGYVPNVVYSCGAVACGDTLVLPYGMADQQIAVATMSVTALLDSIR